MGLPVMLCAPAADGRGGCEVGEVKKQKWRARKFEQRAAHAKKSTDSSEGRAELRENTDNFG